MLSSSHLSVGEEDLPHALTTSLQADTELGHTSGRPSPLAMEALRSSNLLGTSIPVRYGGAGLGAVEVNRRVQAVARKSGSLAIILFQHLAVSSRIAEWGTSEQKASLLPRLARGELVAASAWSEVGAGADKRKLSTQARELADGRWAISGRKTFTTGAGLADLYLVLAQSDAADSSQTTYGAAGQSFFLVGAGVPGLAADTSLDLFGMRSSATGFVELNDCVVGRDALLGPRGEAPKIIGGVRASGVTLGAVSAGLAQRAYDIAHEHAGKQGMLAHPIVRLRLVDLRAEFETARAAVELAGSRQGPDPGIVTLLSKIIATTASERACRLAREILGSAGYTRPHAINQVACDASAIALMGPTNDLCRELIGTTWKKD
jgi:alkylation response protein AidB-like acyl-CoA dehydrogenase